MPITEESRRALFQRAIDSYLARGYKIVSRERWSVTLTGTKKFNWPAFILLAGVFYLPFYAMRRPHTITLSIDPDGHLHTVNGRVAIPSVDDAGRGDALSIPPIAPPIPPLQQPEIVTAGRHQVLCTRHENGAISHIGFRDEIGMLRRMSKRDAIDGILGGTLELFVESNGIVTEVIVVGPPGREFLKTEADSTSGNNLSSLPDCGPTPPHAAGLFVGSGQPLHRPLSHISTGVIMGKVYPYHSASSEDHQVHHDNDNCPTGKQIKEENKRLGEGGRPLCEQCRKM